MHHLTIVLLWGKPIQEKKPSEFKPKCVPVKTIIVNWLQQRIIIFIWFLGSTLFHEYASSLKYIYCVNGYLYRFYIRLINDKSASKLKKIGKKKNERICKPSADLKQFFSVSRGQRVSFPKTKRKR